MIQVDDHPEPQPQPIADLCRRDSKSDWLLIEKGDTNAKKGNKERLIAALQEPLESTFATYKTSALGLVDDQVEENRDIYGENVITKGQEDSMIKKGLRIDHQSFYSDFVVIALVSPMSASKTRWNRIQRPLSSL